MLVLRSDIVVTSCLAVGDALGSSTTNTAINSPDGESSMNSSTSWQRSIEIINNPIMNAAHPQHVERFLCFESYNFLCEVLENSKISTTDAVAHVSSTHTHI
jgi:hypothetical protein